MSDLLPILPLALYGLLGAAAYATPRLMVCRHGSTTCNGRSSVCWDDFTMALFVGVSFAMAYAPWAGHILGKLVFYDQHAFAFTIGLIANPLAPRLVRALNKRIISKIGGTSDTAAAKGESQ